MNIKINKKKYNKILKLFQKFKEKDFTFSSGRILGSMCTQPHPIAKKIYLEFLETNLGDPELFLGTKKIETGYIRFISNLLHAPKTSTGIITSGGSESNLTAIWIAKNLTRKKEIIVPESAHFSFEKISSLMDVKLVYVPLNNEYTIDTKILKKKINNKTAAVVGLAGSSELGTIDQISVISEMCNDENIFLHVDAAFGGFVIPFLKKLGYKIHDFDFKLNGVSSISVDAHKMGCSAIPLGVLLLKNKNWLNKISVETPYISVKKQAGILGTRSGGPVAAAYAVAKYLGKKGYTNLIKNCMNNTHYMEKEINKLGLNFVTKPTMNVLGIKVKNPTKLVKILTHYGWKVNSMERLSAIRIVIMPHIDKKIIDDFILDLKKACKEIGEL